MNKPYKYAGIICALAMVASSCTREDAGSDGNGYLTTYLYQDSATLAVRPQRVTRAEANDEAYILEIYRGDELIKKVTDHRALANDPLVLKTGSYRVQAYNREEVPAIFDSPRFAGDDNVTIKNNEVTSANITCRYSDVLVTASVSNEFAEKFKSWSLSITNGEGTLVWDKEYDSEDRTGYFKNTGSLKWTLTATNLSGRELTATDTYTGTLPAQKYILSFNIAPDSDFGGAGPVKILLDDSMSEKEYDLVVDLSSKMARITKTDPWAKFVDISGSWNFESRPSNITAEYRKSGEDTWTSYSNLSIDETNKTFTGRITGLEPSTAYEIRAVTSSDKEDPKTETFVTESAEVIHNMGFDSWYMSGKAPMPNAEGYSVWDSANQGSAGFGTIPTTQETSHLAVTGEGKSAARLQSASALLGIFAAGNIYTGKFGKVSGLGAALEWGVDFKSRPLALRGYFDYSPAAINKTKDPYTGLSGRPDTCQIQIFLTDRATPYQINTSSGQFVDVNGSDVIAYGKIESGTATSTKSGLTNGYEQFTIKLNYRDLTRKPNMIVIVAAASKYGDYFTGGVGSLLYLDEFEFIYDPSDL